MIRLLLLCLMFLLPVSAIAETEEMNLPKPPPAKPKAKPPTGPVRAPVIGMPYELMVEKEKRSYYLYVPEKPSTSPRPLVVVLHEEGGSPKSIAERTGFSALAEKENFVVAYPVGEGHVPSWNAGRCCGYSHRKNIDDVGFIKAMVIDARKKTAIDKARIYATGFSAGGMMTYRLACDMTSTFAAVGVVGGAMNTQSCEPQGRTSVIIFHSLNDDTVNYDGGAPKGGFRAALAGKPVIDTPTKDAMNFWTKASMCRNFPSNEEREDATIINYFCAQHRDVRLYTLNVGAHSWPGEKVDPKRIEEETDPAALPSAMPGTQLIWDFFRQHPPGELLF